MQPAAVAGWLAVLLGAGPALAPSLSTSAARAATTPPAAPTRLALSHAFRATATRPAEASSDTPEAPPLPDVELLLEQRAGLVRKGGATGKELFDSTDYSGVGEIVASRELLLGPSDPPVTLPPGRYACDLVPGAPGRLRVVLRGQDGLRLALALGEIPPEAARVTRATATAFEQPGDAWVVALRLPTAAGALVLTPSGAEPPPRTPTEVIRRGLRDRLIHGSRPVRRVPR